MLGPASLTNLGVSPNLEGMTQVQNNRYDICIQYSPRLQGARDPGLLAARPHNYSIGHRVEIFRNLAGQQRPELHPEAQGHYPLDLCQFSCRRVILLT